MKELRKKVVIVGQGYVGLPLAMNAIRAGWSVVGFDTSGIVVNRLNSGNSHVEDVSDKEMKLAIANHLYIASQDPNSISDAEICIICVPTPLNEFGLPDLSFIESATQIIASNLKPNALLINESTSYPGTLREVIIPLLASIRSDNARSMLFASAPERIDPGNKVWKLQNTPRLVSGINDESTLKAIEFYKTICSEVVKVSSPEVAEMAKLLENTFRQVNIALVNQLVPLCHKLSIDVREVIEAAGTKPYGYMKFYPGSGVGGHCIPVDPIYLLWRSRQLGLDLKLVEYADLVNKDMSFYVATRLIELAKPTKNQYLAVFGVGYKKGISDTRETPAIAVGNAIVAMGFNVVWLDPLVEKFNYFEQLGNHEVCGIVVITAQPDLPVKTFAERGIPILDCTGDFKDIEGVEQL